MLACDVLVASTALQDQLISSSLDHFFAFLKTEELNDTLASYWAKVLNACIARDHKQVTL